MQVSGQHICAGQRIWVRGYAIGVGHVPVELEIYDGRILDSNRLRVRYVNPDDSKYYAASHDYDARIDCIYLGDLGVRPFNYDNRQPQVFLSRRALEDAEALWNGQNPNFLSI